MASNEKLIDSLVAELKPVKPLSAPIVRTLTWAIPQVLISVIAITLSSPLKLSMVASPQFIIQVILASASLFFGAYLGFSNTIPGLLNEKKKKLMLTPFVLLGAAIAINYLFPVSLDTIHEHRSYCSIELISLMMIGFAHNYFMLKKGFLAFKSTTLVTSLMTSAMIPLIILYFACSFSTNHLIVAHFLPVIVMTGLVTIIFKVCNK